MRWTLIIFLLVLTNRSVAQVSEPTDFLSQEYFISKVTKGSEQYTRSHPVEKIYIHFDRSSYLVGDTAWFTIYVVDSHLEPASNSITVFADWIHPDGTLVKHQQLQVIHGKAAGMFAFSDHPEGLYTIRAYTNLMTATEPDYIYHTQLDLINPLKLSGSYSNPGSSDDAVDLQFFPEGGSLVNGLESRVAFKAIDTSGKGIELAGQLVDDLNRPVSPVKSVHNGMGIFTVKPVEGRSYKVVWKKKNFELPKALRSGVGMSIDNHDPEFIQVKIQASEELVPGKFYLIGQSRRKICFRDMFTLTETSMELQVPKSSIPQGILQLTLFDENSIPRCERMVFFNPEMAVQLDIRFDKSTYSPRELVSLNIHITDANGSPVETEMSVAITDASFLKYNNLKGNIRTQLLLQSDLKGNIEDPGWYFDQVLRRKFMHWTW